MAFLRGVSLTEITPSGIPLILFITYQMMFAIITPALITGAFAGRVRFGAYMIFLTVWLLFVYFPVAHMAWGGGLFSQWGVLDFAGGTVVHATA
jgi:Amt family ammonium transporter